jgi:ankyrin repeat protein
VLLAHKQKPNLSLEANHEAPLDLALRCERWRCASLLIDAGAPLADPPRPRLCTAAGLSVDVVKALVRRGVAVGKLRDTLRRTPLHIAAHATAFDPAVIDMLVNVCGVEWNALEKASGMTCLHSAAARGNERLLGWLIDAGAAVECLSGSGATPLHSACTFSKLQCAQLLVAAGANVRARNGAGDTACHIAAQVKAPASYIHLLLAAGADLDAANADGITARQVLARRGVLVDNDNDAIAAARRNIGKVRLGFVRHRALQICVGLHAQRLDALQMCEILVHACGPIASLVPFHHWWKIAATVKHFRH